MSADVHVGRLEAWAALRQDLLWQRRARSTVSQYHVATRAFWDFLQAHGLQWWQAGPADLQAFLERPAGHNARGPLLSQNSQAHYSSLLLRAYRILVALELLEVDPFTRVRRVAGADPVPRALDLDQVAAVLDQVAGDQRLTVLVWLGYGLGLRVAEMASARIEDVRLGPRPAISVVGKGGKRRRVPLPEPFRQALAAYLAGPPRRTTGPLIRARHWDGTETERALGRRQIMRLLGDAMAAAGVAETAHGLRHTYATELLAADQGRNLRAVSRLLGHASIATTERIYTQSYNADADAAVAMLPDPTAPAMTGPELSNGIRHLDPARQFRRAIWETLQAWGDVADQLGDDLHDRALTVLRSLWAVSCEVGDPAYFAKLAVELADVYGLGEPATLYQTMSGVELLDLHERMLEAGPS